MPVGRLINRRAIQNPLVVSILSTDTRERRFVAFERAVEIPMLVLAVVMLPLILIPEFFDLSKGLDRSFLVLEWGIWAAFALELSIKTYLSTQRRQYLIHHWYDVVIVIIPFLRPLRVARSARLLRMARGMRLMSFGIRLLHEARMIILHHGMQLALPVGGVLFLSLVGLALLFEHHATDGNIHSYGDAIWWGIATITTVGYGDRFPVTVEGRAISVFIMLLGISVFSLVTARVAAMFVRPGQQREEATLEDVLHRLEVMEARLLSVQRRQEDVYEEVHERHPGAVTPDNQDNAPDSSHRSP